MIKEFSAVWLGGDRTEVRAGGRSLVMDNTAGLDLPTREFCPVELLAASVAG